MMDMSQLGRVQLTYVSMLDLQSNLGRKEGQRAKNNFCAPSKNEA